MPSHDYFTNTTRDTFVLRNLDETVKAMLFARYSRATKDLRTLFREEFARDVESGLLSAPSTPIGGQHAGVLADRIFSGYGDDSVAQLATYHIAMERVSNVLTKIIERGRVGVAYLEQSTRYVPYDEVDPVTKRFRYATPNELKDNTARIYRNFNDDLFRAYGKVLQEMRAYYDAQAWPDVPDKARGKVVLAKALDVARGLLPAATTSNVGVVASAQAVERMIMRLRTSPVYEARVRGQQVLEEMEKVAPHFMRRLDRADRGLLWQDYLRGQTGRSAALARAMQPVHAHAETYDFATAQFDFGQDTVHVLGPTPGRVSVALCAAILAERDTGSPAHGAESAYNLAALLTPTQRDALIVAYCAGREDRRHRPGRALEFLDYEVVVNCDYGAFRDLQRHRLLSIDWHPLGVDLGYQVPAVLQTPSLSPVRKIYCDALDSAHTAYHHVLEATASPYAAQYAVPMAYQIHWWMRLNLRELLHMVELRSQPQGHPSYRRIAQEIARGVLEQSQLPAEVFQFVDWTPPDETVRPAGGVS